jgi:hypothetical protein
MRRIALSPTSRGSGMSQKLALTVYYLAVDDTTTPNVSRFQRNQAAIGPVATVNCPTEQQRLIGVSSHPLD